MSSCLVPALWENRSVTALGLIRLYGHCSIAMFTVMRAALKDTHVNISVLGLHVRHPELAKAVKEEKERCISSPPIISQLPDFLFLFTGFSAYEGSPPDVLVR